MPNYVKCFFQGRGKRTQHQKKKKKKSVSKGSSKNSHQGSLNCLILQLLFTSSNQSPLSYERIFRIIYLTLRGVCDHHEQMLKEPSKTLLKSNLVFASHNFTYCLSPSKHPHNPNFSRKPFSPLVLIHWHAVGKLALSYMYQEKQQSQCALFLAISLNLSDM